MFNRFAGISAKKFDAKNSSSHATEDTQVIQASNSAPIYPGPRKNAKSASVKGKDKIYENEDAQFRVEESTCKKTYGNARAATGYIPLPPHLLSCINKQVTNLTEVYNLIRLGLLIACSDPDNLLHARIKPFVDAYLNDKTHEDLKEHYKIFHDLYYSITNMDELGEVDWKEIDPSQFQFSEEFMQLIIKNTICRFETRKSKKDDKNIIGVNIAFTGELLRFGAYLSGDFGAPLSTPKSNLPDDLVKAKKMTESPDYVVLYLYLPSFGSRNNDDFDWFKQECKFPLNPINDRKVNESYNVLTTFLGNFLKKNSIFPKTFVASLTRYFSRFVSHEYVHGKLVRCPFAIHLVDCDTDHARVYVVFDSGKRGDERTVVTDAVLAEKICDICFCFYNKLSKKLTIIPHCECPDEQIEDDQESSEEDEEDQSNNSNSSKGSSSTNSTGTEKLAGKNSIVEKKDGEYVERFVFSFADRNKFVSEYNRSGTRKFYPFGASAILSE